MDNVYSRSLELHRLIHGKLGITPRSPVLTREQLTLMYTPGVAEACREIARDPAQAYELTIKRNTVAIVTDGSRVLGLGNIGPLAALPVMEGKAVLFKTWADIDAFPICLDTQDTEAIIETVRRIAPVFGGINLEDIASPRCFEIERRLQDLGIPVFHDDQHGTAIVIAAAVFNAARVLGRQMGDLRVVIAGAGAAGSAAARLLTGADGRDVAGRLQPVAELLVCDRHGILSADRADLTDEKRSLLEFTNRSHRTGTLGDAMTGADVFIGVSGPRLITADDVRRMAADPVVLALANPEPEIAPDEATAGGAAIVGTGRSDWPNQVNNVLAFPGIFRGALDARATRITPAMTIAAVLALADAVPAPDRLHILPDAFDRAVAPLVARAVSAAAGTTERPHEPGLPS